LLPKSHGKLLALWTRQRIMSSAESARK